MSTAFKLREGTTAQFEAAKGSSQLLPKSLYLIDGKPHFAITSSTEFAFADITTVSQMIAGIIPGTGGEGVGLGTQAGKSPTASGSVGTSLFASHEDHTHPLQTTITGNAATATRLTMPRTIRLTGAVTGNAQFSGDADCQITTTLVGDGTGTGPALWTGTAAQLPSTTDPDTIYFVHE